VGSLDEVFGTHKPASDTGRKLRLPHPPPQQRLGFMLIAVGPLVHAVQGRRITVIAFAVTVAGFGLPEKSAALTGVALFATDLVIRARRDLRTPGPPG
jgi:hypothetical protein